jgi:hypothetical protein
MMVSVLMVTGFLHFRGETLLSDVPGRTNPSRRTTFRRSSRVYKGPSAYQANVRQRLAAERGWAAGRLISISSNLTPPEMPNRRNGSGQSSIARTPNCQDHFPIIGGTSNLSCH